MFREMFIEPLTERIINVDKLQKKYGTMTNKVQGTNSRVKGMYNKASTYKSNVEYFTIPKKEKEALQKALKDELNKKLSKEYEMDFGDEKVKRGLEFKVEFYKDEYPYISVIAERTDNPYYTIGKLSEHDALMKSIISIVDKFAKKELFFEIDGHTESALYHIFRGKVIGSVEFLLKSNLWDGEIMISPDNKPRFI